MNVQDFQQLIYKFIIVQLIQNKINISTVKLTIVSLYHFEFGTFTTELHTYDSAFK